MTGLEPESPKTLAAEALARAMTPAAVARAEGRLFCGMYRLDYVDSAKVEPRDLLQVARRAAEASELRSQAQTQTTIALSVLANPPGFDYGRLTQSDGTIRKPRVMLWAEVTGAGTLQVLWQPVRDADVSVSERDACVGTDYVQITSTWNQSGVQDNVVLRLRDREYLAWQSSAGEKDDLLSDGDAFLRSALCESLSHLVEALSFYCEIAVDRWPEYDEKGNLRLSSVEERASRSLLKNRETIAKQVAALQAEVDDKLSRLGLTSADEFTDASARAAAGGTKLSAVLFARTGKRCTSLQTDSLCQRLEGLLSCQLQIAEVDEALKSIQSEMATASP